MPPRAKRPTPPARDIGAAIAALAIAAALAASAFLVDPRAEASFDAPKRLATLIAVAIGFAAAFLGPHRGTPLPAIWRTAGRLPRAVLILAAAALAGAALSAFASPRQTMALDGFRTVLLFALLLPLGASRVTARQGRGYLSVFLAFAGLNAAVSLLQGRQIFQPFALETIGSRDATGAFVGNVGYLALGLALAAVAAFGIALSENRPAWRVVAGALLLLDLAALVRNQNLTSLTALVAGAVALAASRFGRRALVPALGIVLIAALAVGLSRPTLRRSLDILTAVRAGDWDQAVTYRLGPWSAAAEMARQRPLLGFGPGTFAAESVPHRLSAEIRARRRFVNPLVASSYGEAHSEPLQAVAEGGLFGVAAAAAAVLLLVAAGRTARARAAASPEAAIVFAILVAGAVSSLSWFPLQRPVTAVPLLLAAGRAWRLAADPEEAPEP